ncbi:MAG: dolichyl-phosphate beta-glucosyltransferase [Dehalococcoidia bacterium]
MTTVDIAIPVYNEELALPRSITVLRRFLAECLPQKWGIVIVDNGSTDGTLAVAQALSREYSDVTHIHLDLKGRGRALRQAWLQSGADIVSYMDVDLSTDLAAFPRLIQAIEEGYDLAIGSRLLPGSRVRRSLKREALSRLYNLLIRATFFTRFHDAQCGFKAARRRAAQELVPLVKDQGWFFDSELLILADKTGYRIRELPVAWQEDADSRVNIRRTVMDDILGLARMRLRSYAPHRSRVRSREG